MSANNGVYILKTPCRARDGSFEYRVREAHAIENMFNMEKPNSVRDQNVIGIFGESEVVDSEEEAFTLARALERHVRSEGGILEYGVLMIELTSSFPSHLHQGVAA